MSKRVLEGVAAKYANVKEGVESVMGGRVLEYEAKTIKNAGIAEGINEGAVMTLVSLVRDGILSVTDAALRAKLSEEEFLTKMKQYNQ